MIDEIEKRLTQLGIKKSHLAKQLNMKPSALSHVLKGRREFTIEQKTKVKSYLNL